MIHAAGTALLDFFINVFSTGYPKLPGIGIGTKEDIFMSIYYEIPTRALYLLMAEVTAHHDGQAERIYALSCHFEFILTHHSPHGGAARHMARICIIIREALGHRIMGRLNLKLF